MVGSLHKFGELYIPVWSPVGPCPEEFYSLDTSHDHLPNPGFGALTLPHSGAISSVGPPGGLPIGY